MSRGLFIAGLGIPGSGKSSVLSALAQLLQCRFFAEPEESYWPAAVTERELNGYFSAITWFRSVRAPQLYAAEQIKAFGHIAIVDSYFDKAMHYCLGKPGMEWLINPQDPYFLLVVQMMALDLEHLPDADCIVSFDIEHDDWFTLLKRRGRLFDHKNDLESTFCTQSYYLKAAERLAQERGIKHVIFKQSISTPQEAAKQLAQQLCELNILAPSDFIVDISL